MRKRCFLLFCVTHLLFSSNCIYAQALGLNNATPNASSILDAAATNRGILIPRMTTAQRTAIAAPADGLLVYDTDIDAFYYYDATAVADWRALLASSKSTATLGGWSTLGNAGTVAATNFLGTTDATDFRIRTTNADRMTILANGDVGIGTTAPAARLHISYATAAVISSNQGLIVQNSGGASELVLDPGGAGISYCLSSDNGSNGLRIIEGSPGVTVAQIFEATGQFGIGGGTIDPRAMLDVVSPASPVAIIDRNSAGAGTIIDLYRQGASRGTISEDGAGVVSYNAFTGSHYGSTNEQIETGYLVSLTAANTYISEEKDAEIIYGIKTTSTANDPKVLGSYLGIMDSTLERYKNIHLVMAVGNGFMWVADNGVNISSGDYLISSSVCGHAMKDKGEYAISYIVAKAAEPVDWSKETQTINGVKHKRISVLYESFIFNNALMQLKYAKDEIRDLKEGLLQLETKVSVLTGDSNGKAKK